nr:MAG TPA: alpha-aminoadipate carrier protein [Caudoviricetes sp.]
MTAACTRCGRVWIVSIRTSPVGYVCPDCDLRQRYIAAG